MSVGNSPRANVGGSYGVVSAPQVSKTKERKLVEEDELSSALKEGLEADDFIIYGKASVEEYDTDSPSQKLLMSAFEDVLDSFLESGIISRRHKDIPVGEPLESYTLDEETEFNVGGDTMAFGAGETLETHIDGDDLWIVANLRNDSELARDTRVGAMTGGLDGFSVTVFCKEWEDTPKGERVTDIDWHAVTIGSEQHIKNKKSRFGVAEFKAFSELSEAGLAEKAAFEILDDIPPNMTDDKKGFWDKVREKAAQKSQEAEAEEKAEDAPPATPEAGEEEDDEEDYDSDLDAVMEKVKEEMGEDEHDLIKSAMDSPAEEEEDDDGELVPPGDHEDPEADEDEFPIEEMKSEVERVASEAAEKAAAEAAEEATEKATEAAAEKAAEVAEKAISEAMPDEEVATKSDLEGLADATEKAVAETVPEIIDGTAEKMTTGSTPDPSGGAAEDKVNYADQIKEQFGSN